MKKTTYSAPDTSLFEVNVEENLLTASPVGASGQNELFTETDLFDTTIF